MRAGQNRKAWNTEVTLRRKNTEKGEISESPELRSQNENKWLSVPLLQPPHNIKDIFNSPSNIWSFLSLLRLLVLSTLENCMLSILVAPSLCGPHIEIMTLTTDHWALAKNYSQKSNYVFNSQYKCIIIRAWWWKNRISLVFNYYKIILRASVKPTIPVSALVLRQGMHICALTRTHACPTPRPAVSKPEAVSSRCLIQREFPLPGYIITAWNTGPALIRLRRKLRGNLRGKFLLSVQ